MVDAITFSLDSVEEKFAPVLFSTFRFNSKSDLLKLGILKWSVKASSKNSRALLIIWLPYRSVQNDETEF